MFDGLIKELKEKVGKHFLFSFFSAKSFEEVYF
jgi:hypothetical protein